MTQPDTLHDRLEAEINRRLAVARAATPGPWKARTEYPQTVTSPTYGPDSSDEDSWVISAALTHRPGPDATHIALHDPADAVRRYEGELQVLERHRPEPDDCFDSGAHCAWCRAPSDAFHDIQWPCAEIKSLAHRLGVKVSEVANP